MNYRHIYHAGNFADVFKHIVLVAVLDYLRQKDKPFFVLDTHAGIGLYDLEAEEARRTQESAAGVGQLWGREDVPADAAQYLAIIRAFNRQRRELRYYPGSPLIAKEMLRPGDRFIANELHPEDCRTLGRNLGRDARIGVENEDGYHLLKSLLPPPERRGLVLIDPPFEVRDEFAQMVRGLKEAHKRWATGIYILWYPVKDVADVKAFHRDLAAAGIPKITAAHFMLRRPLDATRLNGCGMAIVNPPWTLTEHIAKIGPWLAETLGGGAYSEMTGIAGEE